MILTSVAAERDDVTKDTILLYRFFCNKNDFAFLTPHLSSYCDKISSHNLICHNNTNNLHEFNSNNILNYNISTYNMLKKKNITTNISCYSSGVTLKFFYLTISLVIINRRSIAIKAHIARYCKLYIDLYIAFRKITQFANKIIKINIRGDPFL